MDNVHERKDQTNNISNPQNVNIPTSNTSSTKPPPTSEYIESAKLSKLAQNAAMSTAKKAMDYPTAGHKTVANKQGQQNIEHDDDADVILVAIGKGCDDKNTCDNPTLSLQHDLESLHVTTVSTARSENVEARGTGSTTSSSGASSSTRTNQNIENNQNITMNQSKSIQHKNISKTSDTSERAKVTDLGNNSAISEMDQKKNVPESVESSQTNEDKNEKDAPIKCPSTTLNALKPNESTVQAHEHKDVRKCDIVTENTSKKFRALESTMSLCDEGSLLEKADSFEGASSSRRLSATPKLQSLEARPIYPNVPYSPYASPYSSPRSHRRRPPLRESRRISIEQSGSFLQLNQYKLMDQIGQGSYGLVKLAYSEEDSTHYAMKILSKRKLLRQAGFMRRGPKKTTSPLDRVYREIAVLKKLDHPNVVKLIEVLDDPMEDSLYMVFELVKQGEVLNIPTDKPLSEERAWSVFRETLLGLEYLHYQRIIHADLKPGNLLLTEAGQVKIADLGVCNEFFGEDATMSNGSTAGTPAFRAPETLNIGKNLYCGKAADIWALGATLYSLLYGNVPFLANSIPILYEKIKHDPLTFPDTPKISDELRDCIKCMLTKDPAQRITLPQLREHPWVNSSGRYPLPSDDENCCLVEISDDDINSVVRSIPKLDTLILIKTMLKKHSFSNPFTKATSGRAPQRGGSRLERFVRAGRSNSAPGAYNMAMDRQHSSDNVLPSLSEVSAGANNEET